MGWTHDGEVSEGLSYMEGMLELGEDSSPKAAAGATSDELIITLTPHLPTLLERPKAQNERHKLFIRSKYGADGSS